MAHFKLKLAGMFATPIGRDYQVGDPATQRVLNAMREEFGEAATDELAWLKACDQFIELWLSKAHAKRKRTLADAALSGVTKDTATPTDDNI